MDPNSIGTERFFVRELSNNNIDSFNVSNLSFITRSINFSKKRSKRAMTLGLNNTLNVIGSELERISRISDYNNCIKASILTEDSENCQNHNSKYLYNNNSNYFNNNNNKTNINANTNNTDVNRNTVNLNINENEKSEEYAIKIITVGDYNTGKTSSLYKFVNNSFDETISMNFEKETICLQSLNYNEIYNITMTDTLAQEKYSSLNQSYYKDSNAIILMYSVVDRKSFENIRKWNKIIEDQLGDSASIILVGSKTDLRNDNIGNKNHITYLEGLKLAFELNINFFYEISNKIQSIHSIDDVIDTIICEVLYQKDSKKYDYKHRDFIVSKLLYNIYPDECKYLDEIKKIRDKSNSKNKPQDISNQNNSLDLQQISSDNTSNEQIQNKQYSKIKSYTSKDFDLKRNEIPRVNNSCCNKSKCFG